MREVDYYSWYGINGKVNASLLQSAIWAAAETNASRIGEAGYARTLERKTAADFQTRHTAGEI